MILDIELTLNRFGFYKPASNKIQLAFFRFAVWQNKYKHSVSVEINWRRQ